MDKTRIMEEFIEAVQSYDFDRAEDLIYFAEDFRILSVKEIENMKNTVSEYYNIQISDS